MVLVAVSVKRTVGVVDFMAFFPDTTFSVDGFYRVTFPNLKPPQNNNILKGLVKRRRVKSQSEEGSECTVFLQLAFEI